MRTIELLKYFFSCKEDAKGQSTCVPKCGNGVREDNEACEQFVYRIY